MLGKLASYLRMCGYDAVYTLDCDIIDDEAVRQYADETKRRLLTRDEQLAARTPDAILLEARDIEAQLAELAAEGFDLELPDEPARCGVCNAPLNRVASDEPTPEYAPDTAEMAVWRCPDCGQHFWQGSHWDDVSERLSVVNGGSG
jgi:uncharacterized protein with PIN domain